MTPGEIPWALALRRNGMHVGTATLLATPGGSELLSRTVLITAHQASTLSPAGTEVDTATNIILPEADAVRIPVERFVTHPGFDPVSLRDDIAVVHLRTGLPGGIQLPTPSIAPLAGTTARVAGWGALGEDGPSPNVLQQVDLTVLTDAEAVDAYGDDFGDGMLAAGDPGGGKGTWEGDDGSPLTYRSADGNEYLAGISSWRRGCGRADRPDVFTRVSHYLGFIETNRAPSS
ncbi:serine protease [Kineosporia sp. J2-2]|uniref:Serine protease n=1 Tax=Kineosporia corallincola TaxID=2835133 RepID=A0ABS5TFR3_9ACTN|nr:serine protease [Kineosporia corallincola]